MGQGFYNFIQQVPEFKFTVFISENKDMLKRLAFYIFLLCTILLSCREYGRFGRNNNNSVHSPNHNPGGSCSSGRNWGGISCLGSSDIDFKAFVSSGTVIDPASPQVGVKDISCEPGNGKGILFHLSLIFSGGSVVNPSGNNTNIILSPESTITIIVYDERYKDPQDSRHFKLTLTAVGGESKVNGNEATFKFHDEYGDVTLEGTFNEQLFTGKVRFNNKQELISIGEDGQKEYRSGRSGDLGNFKIATCSAFGSRQ